MRRARIQAKPNIAKAAKQAVPVKVEVFNHSKLVVNNQEAIYEPPLQAPPPSVAEEQNDVQNEVLKSPDIFARVQNSSEKPMNQHVHFGEDVIDNEQQRISNLHLNVQPPPPPQRSDDAFVVPHPPARLMAPRSRNVSMCEDEAILQPKQPREKKRFTGKEELDTKTWKMSDLTKWNPKNEQASFKRERRSSTSSSVVTKSEYGDFGEAPRVNAPQVKIGADGRLVIDETSLLQQSAQINHESMWETVEEGRMGSKITSMSFRNRIFRKPNAWTDKETDLFYEVLQCTGQDFGLMHHYLPQRSRPELKSKYNREEKYNWPRLLKAISHPVRLDEALEGRIARFILEMEEEEKMKKDKQQYEKEEEKRVREEIRQRHQRERDEEKNKRLQARELVRQAKELERGARLAAKASEKEARAKERFDTKTMAEEAKRIAREARELIQDARRRQREENEKKKAEMEQDSLEREAERIIRRLIQDSQREERKKLQASQKEERRLARLAKGREYREKKKAAMALSALSKGDDTGNVSDGESGDTTSESSTTASSSDDEEAAMKRFERREKARMRDERRNQEPRKSTIEKKLSNSAPKETMIVTETIDFAKVAKGSMFDSANEDDELDDGRHNAPAPPAVTPSVITVVVLDDEPVPQAVHDVINDIIRARSKTPERKSEEGTDKNVEKEKEKQVEEVAGACDTPEAPESSEAPGAPEASEVAGAPQAPEANNDDGEPPAKKSKGEEESLEAEAPVVVEKVAEKVSEKSTEEAVEKSTEEPSTSTAAPPTSLKRPAVRRTIKKPVNYAKKKKD